MVLKQGSDQTNKKSARPNGPNADFFAEKKSIAEKMIDGYATWRLINMNGKNQLIQCNRAFADFIKSRA